MTSVYNALFSAGAATNWLADTITNIENSQNQGGLMGMLVNSGGDGSINTFLGSSASNADNFALIAQNSVVNYSSLIAQMASENIQKENAKKLEAAFKSLQDTQKIVQPKNVNPFVYMPDGSTIDTANNILTMSDGTQYDITTGAKYVDPASIIQMANGSYLDTKNNILTMADGTRIDSVTGIKLSVSA